MPEIRKFKSEDLDQLIKLYCKLFTSPANRPIEEVRRRFIRLFNEYPLCHDGISSLVHVEDNGEINGFIGVLPIHFRLKERDLLGTLLTTMMVSPDCSTMGAGSKLLRKALSQGQDFAYSDRVAANDKAIPLIWKRVGGSYAWPFGFKWQFVIHPVFWFFRIKITNFTGRKFIPVRFLLNSTYLLIKFIHNNLPSALNSSSPTINSISEPLTKNNIIEYFTSNESHKSIVAIHNKNEINWLIQHFDDYSSRGERISALIRSSINKKPIGWYDAYIKHGIVEVVSFDAKQDSAHDVFNHLLNHSNSFRAILIKGENSLMELSSLINKKNNIKIIRKKSSLWFTADDSDIRTLIENGYIKLNGFESEGGITA